MPLTAQLKHVGFCEGLIDFAATFNGPFVSQTLALHKRKYVFLQAEPDLWIVVVMVKSGQPPIPASSYARSTDTRTASGVASAVHAATSRRPALAAAAAATIAESYNPETHTDRVLQAMTRRLYDWHTLFYGSVTRVLAHPAAARMVARLAELRQQLRKLVDKRESHIANYESLLQRAAAEAASHDETTTTTADGAPAAPIALQLQELDREVSVAVAQADGVAAELAILQRISPVTALRTTLRDVLDFALHYTDWANLSPFDAVDGESLLIAAHVPMPRGALTCTPRTS